MSDSPRKSYYQVSFTAGQGLAALLVMLAGLAVSFFLGVRAGFVKAGPESPAVSAAPSESPAESASSVSAAPSLAPSATPAPAARTSMPPREIAGPPAPVVTETFEDREAPSSEASPEKAAGPSAGSSSAPSHTEIAGSSGPLAARTAEKPSAAPRTTKSGFYVQVISTGSKAEAARVRSRLSARKYKASVAPVDSKKGKLYRVRVGPYPDREQAKKVAAKISSEEKLSAWVAPAE